MTTPTLNPTRPNLRQTDFLPARFSGARLDRDDSTAHFLTFADYLDAHDIDTTDASQLPTIIHTFKRALQGQTRLWVDKLTFTNYDDLKDSFIRRFSTAKSTYTHVRDFYTLTMTDGESTEAKVCVKISAPDYVMLEWTHPKGKIATFQSSQGQCPYFQNWWCMTIFVTSGTLWYATWFWNALGCIVWLLRLISTTVDCTQLLVRNYHQIFNFLDKY